MVDSGTQNNAFSRFLGMNRSTGWLTRRLSGWMQQHPTRDNKEPIYCLVDRLVDWSSDMMHRLVDRLVDWSSDWMQ